MGLINIFNNIRKLFKKRVKMLKVFCSLFFIVFATGIDAAQNQYYYSPYSQSIAQKNQQAFQAIKLSAKLDEQMKLKSEGALGAEVMRTVLPTMQMQQQMSQPMHVMPAVLPQTMPPVLPQTIPPVLPQTMPPVLPQARNMMPQPASGVFSKILPKKMAPRVAVLGADSCQGRQPGEKIQFPGNRNKFVVCHLGGTFDVMHCPKHLVFNTHTHHCDNTHKKPKGCSVNPCQNNGRCVDLKFHQFRCECPEGFQGRLCQNHETCSKSDCGQHGVCMQFPKGSAVDHYCICDDGMTYGLTCGSQQVRKNPCLENDADLHSFPTEVDSALFLQCEGHIPNLKFCAYPLVYSHELQRCDWHL